MFRVQENEDGTTSIFCKTTGKHIYTLRSNNQPRIPERTTLNRPINVVGPSRQFGSSSRSGVPGDESEQDSVPDQDFDINSRNTKCLLHPIPISFENDITEDYFFETATQEEFTRSLNLVPKKKFKEEPIEKILKQFPLRLLSRSKAFRSVDISSEEWQYHKPPDDLPLSSNLGVKFLKLNEERNFFNEQKLSIAIKKYDAFCRFPFNTPNPAECNFPKLRCREKKFYPVLTTKASKHEATHVYTYGRRQRLERKWTLKTGLDAESRRLLRICNTKQCSVKLKRLKNEEIEYWRTKKSKPILVIIDDSDDDDQIYNSTVPLNNQSYFTVEMPSTNFPGISTNVINCLKTIPNQIPSVPNQCEINTFRNKNIIVDENVIPSFLTASTSSELVSLPNTPIKPSTYKPRVWSTLNTLEDRKLARRKGCRKCYVRLIDVSKRVHRFRNDYYVKSTNIRVPFYASHLALTHFANCSNITTNICLTERPRSLSINNSYSNQTGSILRNSLLAESSNINSKHKAQSLALVPVPQRRSSSAPLEETDNIDALKIIPYIDLTVDSSPEPDSNNQCLVPKKFFVTQWLFRCFGCGYKRLFTNEASRFQASNVVNAVINEHMKTYHTVDNPENFLSSYLDSFNNCSIIEAFPGYKEN